MAAQEMQRLRAACAQAIEALGPIDEAGARAALEQAGEIAREALARAARAQDESEIPPPGEPIERRAAIVSMDATASIARSAIAQVVDRAASEKGDSACPDRIWAKNAHKALEQADDGLRRALGVRRGR